MSAGTWRIAEHSEAADLVGTVRVPTGSSRLRTLLAYIGPGLLVAVGYMDPGNWATDIGGGAQFGYLLLSVVLISNFIAMVLQYLALKLGIATSRDLAQACRTEYPRAAVIVLWFLCEIAIIACDLAEVIGSAVALNLLFYIPLMIGVLITAMDVVVLLMLQNKGFRYIEALVGSIIFVIAVCFAYELAVSHPNWLGALRGSLPSVQIVTNSHALYLAIGILGATVMPHNLYLHSSVVQTRNFPRNDEGKARAIRYASLDSNISLIFASFINAAILVLSAAAFHGTSHQDIADIGDAYKLLSPALGVPLASTLFAVGLLASGQNSTITGTLAGQIVMEGFLQIRLRPWVRRLLTRLLAVVPGAAVAGFSGERGIGQLLILSQVVLSLQLSFAVFPLVIFTNNPRIMGPFVNSRLLKAVAWLLAVTIFLLNAYLIYDTMISWLKG